MLKMYFEIWWGFFIQKVVLTLGITYKLERKPQSIPS